MVLGEDFMKLTKENLQKLILNELEDQAPPATTGDASRESEEEQVQQVKDVLVAIQKAPQFETKYQRINSQQKFEALFNKLVDWSKDGPMKGKETQIKAALLKIANTL